MPLNDEDRANLVAYLDGELDDTAAQAVEARLQLDPEARAEADALRQAWGLLDYLPRTAPSTDFTQRTLERLTLEKVPRPVAAPPRPRFPWLRTAGWAAAVLIALGGGVALAPVLWPPEPVADPDEALVRYLRVLEKLPLYEQAEDLDFVRQLDQPDLFGDETAS